MRCANCNTHYDDFGEMKLYDYLNREVLCPKCAALRDNAAEAMLEACKDAYETFGMKEGFKDIITKSYWKHLSEKNKT